MRLRRADLGATCSQSRVLLAVGLLVALGAAALGFGPGNLAGAGKAQEVAAAPHLAPPAGTTQPSQQLRFAYEHLPLSFEPNQGQSDPQVQFLAHGRGYGLFLTADEAVLVLQHSAVRMSLAGADKNATVFGLDQLSGKSNYLIGNDPAKWHRDVPQFARVRYQGVYPGIDLVYYGRQGQLEYDFEVAPGANPRQVAMRFQEPKKLKIDSHGDLALALDGGDLRLQSPRVYQRFGEEQRPVAGRFVIQPNNDVGFELGPYDRSRTLIIDPVLTYSSFLGGTGDEACSVINGTGTPVAGCPAIALDPALNIYLAGSTKSSDFPPQPGVLGSLTGTANIFVTKLNAAGSAIVFSTYLGGSAVDTSAGVTVDASSNVVVAGTTTSTDFPTLNGLPTTVASGQHAFVSELNPAGDTLLYSTYLAGGGTDNATGVALDVKGKIYVAGDTSSADFPTTTGAFQTTAKATHQFFFSKVDPTLTGTASLVYSTFVGGSAPAGGVARGGGIAVDSNSSAPSVYLTGTTSFTDMPVLNAAQGSSGGGVDAWVAKFTPTNASGAQEIYLTYIGGSGDDVGTAVAVDSSGQAYVTGSTTSTNITIPTGTTPFQNANAGGADAFLAKIGSAIPANQTAYPINYFSYLGGSGTDVGLGLVVDSIQGARIAGWTNSGDFPHPNHPIQTGLSGPTDAFVARIDTTATASNALGHFGTYLGGSGSDFATSIATDSGGNTYVAGETSSSNFPKASPLQGALQGGTDAFVTKLGPFVALGMTAAVSATNVGVGNQVTFTYTITNQGDLTAGVTFTDHVSASSLPVTVGSPSPSTGCGSVVAGELQCNLGTLNGGQTATVTIPLTPTPPTTPNTAPVTLTNSAGVTVTGSGVSASASAQTTVNDFVLDVEPPEAPPVVAGVPASYTAFVTPFNNVPQSVSLACSSGLPTGVTCTFPNGSSFQNLSNGKQSRLLVVNTTPRVTTPASLWREGGPVYAIWLPVGGLALLGAGVSGRRSRKRRLLMGLILSGFFALIFFQAGCGSKTNNTPTTTGTPAGTYSITVTATSGSASRTQQIKLVVQ